MCGLLGIFSTSAYRPLPQSREELDRLRDALKHRGPDAGESWISEDGSVALLHRRLKVIDLAGGRQPMSCPEQRHHLIYNGEIYNYRELREELESLGHRFRTHSDTEVLLTALIQWGDAALRRLNGIFAFVFWDARERRVLAARDPLGVKPLYFGEWNGLLYFASEAGAIVADRRVPREIDPLALDLYFHHSYVPAPRAIWRGMQKLEAAHSLGVELAGRWRGLPEPRRYWEIPFGGCASVPMDENALLDELDGVLRRAVHRQMVSDVPLGAFLSGGVDSSLVVSYMAERSRTPVQTFCVGYDDARFDERAYARQVSERFGTEHHELKMGAQDVGIIDRIAQAFDEPFADTAAAPTMEVSALARRRVTVVLSGDGGDETHTGYPRYLRMQQLAALDRIPLGLRRACFGTLSKAIPSWKRRGLLELAATDTPGRYDALMTKVPWPHRRAVYAGDFRQRLLRDRSGDAGAGGDWCRRILSRAGDTAGLTDRLQFLDLASYLPDQLMPKVDRASMAVSLEARVPLLDLDAVQFAAAIPASLRIGDGRPKYLLRRLLARRIDAGFADRKKHGFRVPKESWLRAVDREQLRRRLVAPGIERWISPTALERLLLDRPRGLEFAWPFLVFAAWLRHHEGAA